MLSRADFQDLVQLIKQAAHAELLPRFTHTLTQFKQDGSVVTAADTAMQSRLQQVLAQRWPALALLGEEMPVAQQQQLIAQHPVGLWLVDPLDGTTNFSSGLPCFAVSVALMSQRRIELGVVYDPLRDECFTAQRGQGAFLNGERLSLSACAEQQRLLIGMVDFKRLPDALARRLATAPPYQSQRSFGSVVLDWCWLAAGRAQVYVHGRQNLWDYAAGSLIFAEAGGYASTLEGEPVFTGELAARSAVLAINAELYAQWMAYLRSP